MKPKLLVVDDDQSVLESLRRLLVSEDSDVLPARDGVETIGQFTSNPVIDLVVLDLKLGLDDGWEVFKTIAELNPCIPAVVITAMSGQKERATALGVDALIENDSRKGVCIALAT